MIMVTILISLVFINIVSCQPTIFEWICDPNIYDSVETTILCDYIMQANLDDVLNDTASNITLFAPNNQAFMDLSSEISAQLNDPSKLQDLLLYHAVSPEISVTVFEGNDIITMLNNGTVTTNLLGTPWIIIIDELGGRANIISEDSIASNGLVQFMDAVLLPSSFAPIITTTTPMNTTTSSPINTTSTPLPIDIVYPRAGHASCLYNNSIYIIGGRNSSDSSIVDSVEIDLMSNISMTFDPIFTQLQAGSQSFGCSLDGEIYYSAFGKDALISDDIMMYDIDTGDEMFLFKGTVRQPCVAYNSEYNVLYIIGGSDDIQLEMASNIVMECELFNYTCVQMSRLIEARVEHTCQYVNNKLYAIIGTSSSIEYLNDTSGNSSWNILARMTYPHPISGMRSILVEELIYIIGGENIAGFIGSVLIIDTVNDALISSSINLEIPRTRHSLIYDPDTQLIYVIGGFNGEYLKSVETIKNGSTVITSTTTEAPKMDKNNTGYIAGLIVGLVSPLVCGLGFLWIYQNYINPKRYVSDSTTDESKKLTNQP